MRLTQEQVADKFGVSRNTVQNWETGVSPITPAVEMSCEIWGERLKQEDPDLGPVTLIYSTGPMFINPQGPRRPMPMIRREPYLTNAAALARVQKLCGRDDFNDPSIIEESGKPLWNVVELRRVVSGGDAGAPTVANLLRRISEDARRGVFARSGPSMSGAAAQQAAIEAVANEIEQMASTVQQQSPDPATQREIDGLFDRLRKLGKRPTDSLVGNIAQAFVATEMPIS